MAPGPVEVALEGRISVTFRDRGIPSLAEEFVVVSLFAAEAGALFKPPRVTPEEESPSAAPCRAGT
jgi:hypothetical protein